MSPRRTPSVVAWSLWGLWVALAVLCVGMTRDLPIWDESILVVALTGYASVSALVVARHPDNAVGWLMMAVAYTVLLQTLGEAYVFSRSHPGYQAVAWVTASLFSVWLLIIVTILPLVFPTGRLLSRRWRPAWWFSLATLATSIIGIGLQPGKLDIEADIENPLGVHGWAVTVVKAVNNGIWVAIVASILLAAASLVLRFRRSSGTERQQMKWFALAGLTTVAGLTLAVLGAIIPRRWGDPVGNVGWVVFLAFGMLGIPVATGIAVMKHHLYDIDVVINRTLVYGTLSAALAATYVGSVLLLNLVLSPLAGESALSVAGSTLAVAALFRPARTRIQAVVDRRFYRSRYDAARTLDEFALRLRHEVDLDAVGADLCLAADQTVQPSHVSLWLRP